MDTGQWGKVEVGRWMRACMGMGGREGNKGKNNK